MLHGKNTSCLLLSLVMAWSPNLIVYPFLLAAIYYEFFLLVTFLSKPARDSRKRSAPTTYPHVAIIVPCWNEENTIESTTKSLLALKYPSKKLSIVLVNDGSTDNTKKILARFAKHPQIKIINKENGGKYTALNAGISSSPEAELVGCLDADSLVASDALREIVSCFEKQEVMATTAAMSVHKPHTLLQHMQYAEYIFGIMTRHILSSVNGIYVTPGPFSIYRSKVFRELGNFRHGYQTEDLEMALRIQYAGYKIENSLRARVYTKTPPTLRPLLKQRVRWTSGFLRNILYDYRGLIANPRYNALGLFILPFALFSMFSGISLFSLSIFEIAKSTVHSVSVAQGVPLTYALSLHSFSWFYLPFTVIFFLGGATLLITLMFIVMGKRLSNTPGNLTVSAIAYSILYGFVAPLWLIRSVADVASGVRRSWR